MNKNRNSKMTTNSHYEQLNLKQNKNELSKQLEQEQNHRNGGLSVRRGRVENGRKGTGNKKHNW